MNGVSLYLVPSPTLSVWLGPNTDQGDTWHSGINTTHHYFYVGADNLTFSGYKAPGFYKIIESAWFLLLILYVILALHSRFSGTLYVWLLDWEIHTKTQQKTLPILNFHKFSYLNKVDKSIWLVLGYSGIYIFKLSILFKHLVWLIHVGTDNPLSF